MHDTSIHDSGVTVPIGTEHLTRPLTQLRISSAQRTRLGAEYCSAQTQCAVATSRGSSELRCSYRSADAGRGSD